MKLLVIGSDRNVFDPESAVRKRLVEQGAMVDEMHIIVFSLRKAHYVDERISDNAFIHPTDSWSKIFYLFDAWRIGIKIIPQGTDDWVISVQDPFESGIVGYVLALTRGQAFHIQLHTDPFSPFWRHASFLNTIRFSIGMFLLTRADGIRIVSNRIKQSVVGLGVLERKLTVVPIFTETALREGEKTDLHQEYPGYTEIILSVGRLEPEKDFALLLRAFQEVRKTYERSLLIIVGNGSQRTRLVALSEWLGIDEHVRFLPWSHDVIGYYKTADCYVQPSLYEGWGLAVIEAMSAGAPIVMTDVGCAGEVVVNEESGLVVPAGNADALADAISRILGDHGLRERLKEGAHKSLERLPDKRRTYDFYKKSWDKAYEAKKSA